jgi:cyclopropane fatty-acyl-phospholipid synthase-like methyltransferase
LRDPAKLAIQLLDYREEDGRFDRIVSGGMFDVLAHFIREAVRRQVMGSDEAAGSA